MISAPRYPPAGTLRFKFASWSTHANVGLYRRTGGRLGGRFLGMPVLLLDHVGRRSGLGRTTPLNFLRDGDRFVVVGSRGGSDLTPSWWLNLQSNPRTTIQVGAHRTTVTAREATGHERERLWPRLLQRNSGYRIYQQRTRRELPVIILTPTS
jgi:F420H(2)-dependent quinone reductase